VENKTVKMVVKDLLSADNQRRKEDAGYKSNQRGDA